MAVRRAYPSKARPFSTTDIATGNLPGHQQDHRQPNHGRLHPRRPWPQRPRNQPQPSCYLHLVDANQVRMVACQCSSLFRTRNAPAEAPHLAPVAWTPFLLHSHFALFGTTCRGSWVSGTTNPALRRSPLGPLGVFASGQKRHVALFEGCLTSHSVWTYSGAT